ncbi:Gfo/Idh/MocA family oxidoreductase [Herbiconiux moechotypicola]|nr:Gfo/Idh/MocA family oxidoreductase [Herbiconiux moechotypicola]MCS5729167.1 Gfo/Idh/MocA family oxidoreductase [Herbiconiux moechotypicola]
MTSHDDGPRLRWGVLGAGKIAAVFVADALSAGIDVAAVGARDGSRAAAFAERFGIRSTFGSYEELCASPEVDVIYVATPQAFHAEQALLAIAAGKHVLVEKAFTTDAASTRRVLEAARAAGVVVLEAMWTRFTPTMREVRTRVERGDLGALRAVRTAHHQKLDLSPTGRHGDPALAGGALLDLGVYAFALAIDLLGEPAEVIARGRLDGAGVDLALSVLLDYPSLGAQASLQVSMAGPGPNDATILGDGGWIHLDAPYFTWTPFQRYDASRPSRLVEEWTPTDCGAEGSPYSSRGMQFQALELERCVAAGLLESPLMPHTHTLSVMAAMDAARAQLR